MVATSWCNIYPLRYLAKVADGEDYPWRKMSHVDAMSWAFGLSPEDYAKYTPYHDELREISDRYRSNMLTATDPADIDQELEQLEKIEKQLQRLNLHGYNTKNQLVYFPTTAIYDPGSPAADGRPAFPRRMNQNIFRLYIGGFDVEPGGGVSPRRYRTQLMMRKYALMNAERQRQREAERQAMLREAGYTTTDGINDFSGTARYPRYSNRPQHIPRTPPVEPMTTYRKVNEIAGQTNELKKRLVHWVLSGQIIPDTAGVVAGGVKAFRDSPAGQYAEKVYFDPVPVDQANEHWKRNNDMTNYGKTDLTGIGDGF